jgi:hypothetical protein
LRCGVIRWNRDPISVSLAALAAMHARNREPKRRKISVHRLDLPSRDDCHGSRSGTGKKLKRMPGTILHFDGGRRVSDLGERPIEVEEKAIGARTAQCWKRHECNSTKFVPTPAIIGDEDGDIASIFALVSTNVKLCLPSGGCAARQHSPKVRVWQHCDKPKLWYSLNSRLDFIWRG